jgi:lipopolysaccharide export LptBFGC system permease protein LptF
MIETFYPDTKRMAGVHIFWPSKEGDGGKGKMIEAESASWVDGQWLFAKGAMWESTGPKEISNSNTQPTRSRVLRTIFDETTIPELEETPDWIEREYRVSHVDGLRDLRKLTLSLRQMLAMGLMERDPQVWGSQFHSVLAQPWTCVVVVLIALPFGFNHGSRNATAGLATSLMIVFGYFAIQRFFHALGVGGKIEPWMSGWIPNIVFASLGVIMIRRSR